MATSTNYEVERNTPPLLNQRVLGFEEWETAEVAVNGPEFAYAVALAAGRDAGIVDHSTADPASYSVFEKNIQCVLGIG